MQIGQNRPLETFTRFLPCAHAQGGEVISRGIVVVVVVMNQSNSAKNRPQYASNLGIRPTSVTNSVFVGNHSHAYRQAA